ncbi:MAG: RbsD/FucU domain-containing protein, partial [Bacteroidota bacterium]
MLRNLDPLLGPDLLHALASMGHGDEIVIADANFPGASTGPLCIRADGATASDMLRAVLSIMPLDSFVPDPALTMQVVGDADAVPEAVAQGKVA